MARSLLRFSILNRQQIFRMPGLACVGFPLLAFAASLSAGPESDTLFLATSFEEESVLVPALESSAAGTRTSENLVKEWARVLPAAEETASSRNYGNQLDPRSRTMRLALLGHWAIPGEIRLSPRATLWDAFLAGGGAASGAPGWLQIMRGNALLMQVNLAEPHPRETSLASLGLKDGDILQVFPPAPPPAKPSGWNLFKEGLSVTVQVLAVCGSLLSTYLTYSVLHDQGKI